MITAEQIKTRARELGFIKIGIVPAEPLQAESELLQEWLARDYHGKMGYLARAPERRSDPKLLLPSARSVICLAFNYYTKDQHSADPEVGKISRYAWGDDYHDLLGEKLQQLIDWLRAAAPELEAKAFVDAGPMMDKAWAVRAGIGWLGKHSNVITRDHGSWIFLAEILINLVVDYDHDQVPDYCGSCTRCLDACPTQAIVAPYLVDARRCISYGTIELKDPDLPVEINGRLNNWIFGCDICQDVCPWNRFSRETDEPGFHARPENLAPKLTELATLSPEEFKQRYQGSPIKRPKHAGFMRNVAAVMAQQQSANNGDDEEK